MTLKLSIGTSDCDRMRPLIDGTIAIEGVTPDWHVHGVQDLFNLQCAQHTYDATEFPLATYLRDLEGARRYLALPVFPSRHFRFSCVFVNKTANIKSPADLAGKRIGIPVWDMAAAVWLRGIFDEHYGLDMRAPIYVTNGLEAGRTGDEHPQSYPDGFQIVHANDAGGLSQMLADGTVDALYTAGAPSSFAPHDADCPVTRLFDDPVAAETAYYKKSGIFPPMHIFAIKRDIAEANPGLTRQLYTALCAAQADARFRLYNSAALNVMLPWLQEHLLETERRLGTGYWSSGYEANQHTMETVIGYMKNEGLLTSDIAAADMFDAEMLTT